MIQLNTTESGIYYLHEYIPKRFFSFFSEDAVAISEEIWRYKDGECDALRRFTAERMEAVAAIANDTHSNKFGLVAVPPSKVGKESPIRKSIQHMIQRYRQGVAQKLLDGGKELYDCCDLLTRVSDIDTAHEGVRATYEEQLKSIACGGNNLSRRWTTFIILDDVTTLGTSMDACRDVLLEHRAKERYIKRLAIARTVQVIS